MAFSLEGPAEEYTFYFSDGYRGVTCSAKRFRYGRNLWSINQGDKGRRLKNKDFLGDSLSDHQTF